MIRRARLSFKPNVRPGGRGPGPGAAGGGDGGAAPQPETVHDTGKDNIRGGLEESATQGSAEAQLRESGAERHEKTTTVSDESLSSVATSTPLQRRKRISTLPNLAKPRVSNAKPVVASPPKPPQVEIGPTLPVSNVPCQTEVSPPEKAKLPSPPKSQAPVAATQAQHVALPEKRTPVPQVPQFSPYKKSVLKQSETSPVKPVECSPREEPRPLKERPSQKSINEDFVTNKLVTSKKTIVGNLEKERLRRSKKLRELLRDELRKERKIWKEKHPVIPITVEPERSKMVMRDFIHFIPANNPMTSSLEETKTEKSPPTESQPTQGPVAKNSNVDEDDPDEDEGGEDDDSQLLAPRVKVAEDGSIILDEESLTVEVIRNKAPIVEGNDPIFERGSTTTYSSFRKSNYSKPWSDQETDMFFLAISMVGTDFSMIGQLFPHRERTEIKNKFKREERANGWRIDKAFREKKSFDFEFFAQLLEKALEAGKKKPKTPRPKQPREKKATKSRKKQKDKSAAEHNLSDGESANLSEGERADARSAEKENEVSHSVRECSPAPDPVPGKKRRTRKKKGDIIEAEEENPESQGGDMPQIPKKKESKKKSKTPEGSTESKPEHEPAANDKSPEDVQAEKKRGRKKKSAPKESEVEKGGNIGTDKVQDSITNECIANESCDVPEETADDAHAFSETAEVDLSSESVTIPVEDESSLMLFTEESKCHSGVDELSRLFNSMQDSPDQQPEAQITDATLVAENTASGGSCSVESSLEETSPSTIDSKSNTFAKESSAGDVEAVEQDLEPKDKQQIVRGRCKRPVPNLSRASVKKEVSTGKQGNKERQTDACEHSEVGQIAVGAEKTPVEDAMDVDKQTEPGVKSEESMSPNVCKESSKPSAPCARGRFQRPKPNLQIQVSSKRKKLGDEEIPAEIKEQSTDVSGTVSQSHKEDSASTAELDSEEMEVSSVDESHRQVSSAPFPVLCPIQKDLSSESPSEQPVGSVAASVVSGPLDINKEKPQPVRGRLLRPKPNLTKIPAKMKPCVTEQDIQNTSQSQDSAQPSSTDIMTPSRAATRDQKTKVKEKSEPPSCSQEQRMASPLKPAILARGRSQRPSPSIIKPSAEMGKSDAKEATTRECAVDLATNSSDLPCSIQDNIHSGNQETGMFLHKNGVSSSCPDPLSSVTLIKDNDSVPGDSTMAQNELTESVSQPECKKSPIKPNLVARGRLGRPKPNLLKTCGQKGATQVGEDKSVGATFENTTEKIALDSSEKIALDSSEKLSLVNDDELSVLRNSADLLNEVPSDESGAQVKSCSDPIDSVQSSKGELVPKGSDILTEEPQKPLKPAVPTRGRFQKPKPNLGRAATKRDALTSPNLPNSPPKGESDVKEVLEPDVSTPTSSTFEVEISPVLAKSNHEESVLPVIQSSSPLLENPHSHHSVPGAGRADTEEPAAPSNDFSAHVVEDTLSSNNGQKRKHSFAAITSDEDVSIVEEEDEDTSSIRMISEKRDCVDESVAESSKPILKTGRFQRPKPNLSRAATRLRKATVPEETSTGEKLGVGTSSIEIPISSQDAEKSARDVELKSCAVGCHSTQLCEKNENLGILNENTQAVQLEEAAHTGEQVEGSSVKPIRGRFQKARPNIGRAAVRSEAPAISQRTSALEQDEVKSEVSRKVPEPQQSETVTDTSLTSHGTKEAGQANEEKPTAIKPAQLRRFKHVKPVPNLVKLSSKRPSPSDSERRDEVEASPVLITEDPAIEVHVPSPANKRKASECNEDVPKRSRQSEKSQRPSYLSDPEVDQDSLPSKTENSSQSAHVQEQSNPQQSRFGRPLRKTLPTTPPVLPTPSESSSQRPENGKTRQRLKPSKSKVSKPASNKSKGKTTLVKIRATQQEDEEEEDAELDFEEEDYNLAPDMLNQAPVFVPFSLRSPKYVPAEIEETLEEFEIPVEDKDVLSNASLESGTSSPTLEHPGTQAHPTGTEHCDGSTEAAMTLISMGNSVSHSNIGESVSSDHCAEKELPPNPRSQKHLEQFRRFESSTSPTAEHLLSNKPSVFAPENSTTINARSVEDHSDLPSSLEEYGSLPRPETTQSDIMISPAFHSSENSLHAFSDNLVMSVDQTYHSMQEEAPQQDLSDSLLGNGCPAEEATFILTLVEIPINEDFAYSCDSNSADSLPAPVIISSGTSQTLTQNQSSGYPVSLESVSYEPPTVVQEDAELMCSQSSRKRNASESIRADGTVPEKKIVLPESIQQEEDYKRKALAVETDCDMRSTHEASPAEPVPEDTMEFTQTEDFPVGGEMLPSCTKQSDSVHIDKPATDSTEVLNTNLPSTCTKIAAPSKPPLKRPGRKPLGFLPLVCKDKQTKKANKETSKMKKLPKSKKLPTPVCRPQKHSPVLSHEDATSNTVPSQCTVTSAVTPTPNTKEVITPECQVSDTQTTEPQELPNDLGTEEEAAPVSEYFFSDIFMEIND